MKYMSKAIAIATTLILLGFTASTQAQSPAGKPEIAPASTVSDGSAATLKGVEGRSININFNVAAPDSFELPTSSSSANPTSLPGLESIEIKPGLEGVNNPSNVYPLDNSARGGGVQVLYRIKQ
jgi:hypothetical protein